MEYQVQRPQHPEPKSGGLYARYDLIFSSHFICMQDDFVLFRTQFWSNFRASLINAACLRCAVAAVVAAAASPGLVAAAKDI